MKATMPVAMVTGATGGIGRVLVGTFLKRGMAVAAVDLRRPDAKTRRAWEIKKAKVILIKADVAVAASVRRAVAKILAAFGRIDILVNAAGMQAPIGEFSDVSLRAWEKNVAVNLFGTAACCRAVLPCMLRAGSGHIVNFSGGGATSSRPNFSAYAASKTAVVRLTEILADELAGTNVTVNAVSPGAVNTAMLKEVLRAGKKAGEKEFAAAKRRAKGGGTRPEAAAELVMALTLGNCRRLTGKLVSAVWDDWRRWDAKKIKELNRSELLTLRRKT